MGTLVNTANSLAEKVMAEVKPRLMNQYRSIKWQNSLRDDVASVVADELNDLDDVAFRRGYNKGFDKGEGGLNDYKESVKNQAQPNHRGPSD